MNKCVIEKLLYQPDPTEIFNRIHHLPYPILLDSCHPNKSSRYDIITADPASITYIKNNHVAYQKKSGIQEFESNPFEFLNDIYQKNQLSSSCNLPFQGGLIGFFSYESVYLLEKLPKTQQTTIDIPILHFGDYHWAIINDHQRKETIFISRETDAQHRLSQITDLLNTSTNPTKPFQLTSEFEPNYDNQSYLEKFKRIKEGLKAGEFYQINLSQQFSANYSGDPWTAYKTLRKACPSPFSSFISLPENKAILSFSPEQFLQINHDLITTKPIKGTRRRSPDSTEDQQLAKDLVTSPKDRAENLMIVDLLRNDLSKVCLPGSVKANDLFKLETFPNVHHLVSQITGIKQPTLSPIDILKACFPGGSITGAPKTNAIKMIQSLEPHQRSIFCGSICMISYHGRMDSNIAIRTAACDQSQIHFWGGSGIVSDSDCQAEHNEIQDKITIFLQALQNHHTRRN